MKRRMEDMASILKSLLMAAYTAFINFFIPIDNFLLAIAILATINVIFGWLADEDCGWCFKKAFKAILYLIGYMGLLMITFFVGVIMHLDQSSVAGFASWITWVMIYFYGTNVLRNWKKIQPDNKVIAFLYWVATVKFIEKIKFMKEYKETKKRQKTDNDM